MSRTLLVASLTALSLSAMWGKAEERYPAASFEPKVIYRAESAPTQAVEYPAAGFTPQVIFRDPNLIEATGPLESPTAAASGQLLDPPAAKDPQTPPRLAAISDVTPPYAALGLAVAAIALAFWQSRRQRLKVLEPFDPAPAQGEGGSGQEVQGAEEEQDLEALALEVERTLATTNRQRAGKTKRTRRR
jgi:hypothetical protein